MSSNKEWLDIFAIFCSKPFLFYEGFFFLRETDYEYDSKACLENQSDNFNLHNNNHKLSPKIQFSKMTKIMIFLCQKLVSYCDF